MEKMIGPGGVKASMCCASCRYYTYKMDYQIRNWCSKKNARIMNLSYRCEHYNMAEFFKIRGYKPVKK